MEPNLSQALHLLNGSTIHSKIIQGKLVANLLAAGKTPEQVLDNLYIRTLTRRPTDKERKNLLAILNTEKNKRQALEDVFWALMNSREFVFNH